MVYFVGQLDRRENTLKFFFFCGSFYVEEKFEIKAIRYKFFKSISARQCDPRIPSYSLQKC